MVNSLLCFQSYKSAVTWDYVQCINIDNDAVLLVHVFTALSFIIRMSSSYSKIIYFKTITVEHQQQPPHPVFTVNLDLTKRLTRFLCIHCFVPKRIELLATHFSGPLPVLQ